MGCGVDERGLNQGLPNVAKSFIFALERGERDLEPNGLYPAQEPGAEHHHESMLGVWGLGWTPQLTAVDPSLLARGLGHSLLHLCGPQCPSA